MTSSEKEGDLPVVGRIAFGPSDSTSTSNAVFGARSESALAIVAVTDQERSHFSCDVARGTILRKSYCFCLRMVSRMVDTCIGSVSCVFADSNRGIASQCF